MHYSNEGTSPHFGVLARGTNWKRLPLREGGSFEKGRENLIKLRVNAVPGTAAQREKVNFTFPCIFRVDFTTPAHLRRGCELVAFGSSWSEEKAVEVELEKLFAGIK